MGDSNPYEGRSFYYNEADLEEASQFLAERNPVPYEGNPLRVRQEILKSARALIERGDRGVVTGGYRVDIDDDGSSEIYVEIYVVPGAGRRFSSRTLKV